MIDWREIVYHASQFPQNSREYWDRVEEYIIDRDGHRCQACRKSRRIKAFTAHHILPRREGGQDDPDNLITLCTPCHDYVEALGLKTRAEIVNCTRFMNKKDILRAVLSDNADVPPVAADLKEEKSESPVDDDRAEILCPCGIYHIRKTNKIGTSVKEIRCVCGLVGKYEGGVWAWAKPAPTHPTVDAIKPQVKKKRPRTFVKKRVYERGSIQCPLCLEMNEYFIDKDKLITCKCGNQALRVQGADEIDWVWFGRVKLNPIFFKIRP